MVSHEGVKGATVHQNRGQLPHEPCCLKGLALPTQTYSLSAHAKVTQIQPYTQTHPDKTHLKPILPPPPTSNRLNPL